MLFRSIATLVFLGAAGIAAGCSAPSTSGWPPKPSAADAFTLRSPAFADGDPIPGTFATAAGGGKNYSPPLQWSSPPDGTQGFALEVIDMYPAARQWVHWLVADIPATSTNLAEGASGRSMPQPAFELENGFGERGWGGPQPPRGSGRHEYRFTLIALDTSGLDLPRNASLEEFRSAVREHALGSATLTGTAQR